MTSSSSAYPIRAVARLTGLSIDTLRAWERRYHAVVPERGERGRIYRDVHVARLKRLAALVQAGHAIGAIAQLSDAQLSRLLDQKPAAHAEAAPSLDLAELMRALDRVDLSMIDAVLNRFAILLPPEPFITEVVLPLLRELGDRWEARTLTPAQEHLVSATVRTVLGSLLRTTPAGARPIVAFATPQGERHELGLLAGAVLSATAGFRVLYLGPDLPAEDIVDTATRANASAIVMSTTMADSHAAIETVRKSARKIPLFVGGAKSGRGARSSVHHVTDLPALVPELLAHIPAS